MLSEDVLRQVRWFACRPGENHAVSTLRRKTSVAHILVPPLDRCGTERSSAVKLAAVNKSRSRPILWAVASICILVAITTGVGLWAEGMGRDRSKDPGLAKASLPLGVLGDSDSHSYQDRVTFAPGTAQRGGAYRASTFQWTEVLARLRGDQLDLGDWGVWGHGPRLARLQEWFGLPGRAPRKEDYRYNLSLSGAECEQLTMGPYRQAPRLRALMDREPERWRNGVVVIRIGVNSFGMAESLDQLAKDPAAPAVRATIVNCVQQIKAAIALIHQGHPLTRIVLVGILNNADWPPYFDRWPSPAELDSITSGLNAFDLSLRQLAAADRRLAFFDDRAWFAQRWGTRGERGQPDYKTVSLRTGLEVAPTQGDHSSHFVLADGHAGVAWNALWAQSLVLLIKTAFDMQVSPITDAEVARFLQSGLTLER
jgi:hypothetical protein